MKLQSQRQRHNQSTSAGRKGIWSWIITLSILLVMGMTLILGVHLGRQGLQIAGITVIPKPCTTKCTRIITGSPRANYHSTQMDVVKAANSVPEIYGPYRGVVDLAHDGDTVNIRLDIGFDITIYARVRVKGINAPELSTESGKRARDFAQSVLPPGKEVLVTSFGWDKYGGRIDGVIEIPPYVYGNHQYTDFASLMLDSGNAVVYNP